jgi:hypothetical protein
MPLWFFFAARMVGLVPLRCCFCCSYGVGLVLLFDLFALYLCHLPGARLSLFSYRFICVALLLFAYGVGLSLLSFWSVGGALRCLPKALAFPCFLFGLFALPLCGAAPIFLCRRKEK